VVATAGVALAAAGAAAAVVSAVNAAALGAAVAGTVAVATMAANDVKRRENSSIGEYMTGAFQASVDGAKSGAVAGLLFGGALAIRPIAALFGAAGPAVTLNVIAGRALVSSFVGVVTDAVMQIPAIARGEGYDARRGLTTFTVAATVMVAAPLMGGALSALRNGAQNMQPFFDGGILAPAGGPPIYGGGAVEAAAAIPQAVSGEAAATVSAVIASSTSGGGGGGSGGSGNTTEIDTAGDTAEDMGNLDKGLGTYETQGGHHPMAKSAFEGIPSYDSEKAITISKDQLESFGVKHSTVTGQQHSLYSAYAATDQPLTMSVMRDIEIQALVNSGVPVDYAVHAVDAAIADLIKSGVTAPATIPWN